MLVSVSYASTESLTNATLPYIKLANEGWEEACEKKRSTIKSIKHS